jgi:hypothetical protein
MCAHRCTEAGAHRNKKPQGLRRLITTEQIRTLRKYGAGHQWFTPVILATQEAEIGRITVPSQSRQILHKTLSQKKTSEKGLVEWLKV